MPPYDPNTYDPASWTESERAAAIERSKRETKMLLSGGLWRCFVDILDPNCSVKVERISQRLDMALAATGAKREDAIIEMDVMGAGHDPEKMKQGISGTGTMFMIFSQEVLDAFLALGGDQDLAP